MYAEGDGLARVLGHVQSVVKPRSGGFDVQISFFPTGRPGLRAASASQYAKLGETVCFIWEVLPHLALLTPTPKTK
jgi:hypothetical protein